MSRPVLWTAAEAAAATGGTASRPFAATGVAIDSRRTEPGDLFIALQGPRHADAEHRVHHQHRPRQPVLQPPDVVRAVANLDPGLPRGPRMRRRVSLQGVGVAERRHRHRRAARGQHPRRHVAVAAVVAAAGDHHHAAAVRHARQRRLRHGLAGAPHQFKTSLARRHRPGIGPAHLFRIENECAHAPSSRRVRPASPHGRTEREPTA